MEPGEPGKPGEAGCCNHGSVDKFHSSFDTLSPSLLHGKYGSFYREFLEAIQNTNSKKYELALRHIKDMILQLYSRNVLFEKKTLNNTPADNADPVETHPDGARSSGCASGIHNVSNVNAIALPLPYPSHQFQRCVVASTAILKLVDHLTQDTQFIVKHFSNVTDEFVSKLYRIFRNVYLSGPSGAGPAPKKPAVRCYINRSDFMLHAITEKPTNNLAYCGVCVASPCMCGSSGHACCSHDGGGGEWPKLIETNCIAVSLSSHSSALSHIHANTLRHARLAAGDCPATQATPRDVSAAIAQIINNAVATFTGNCNSNSANNHPVDSVLLVYLELGTIFDWGKIATLLQDNHNMRTIAHTMRELTEMLENGTMQLIDGDLIINKFEAKLRVRLIYFRTCYVPLQINGTAEWHLREILEMSSAIKVPSVPTQLVCSKFGQMAWSDNQFIAGLPPEIAGPVLNTRIEQCDPALNATMRAQALEDGEGYVLKSHLEGGFGNLFGQQVSEALAKGVEPGEYVLMKRVFPPRQPAVFVTTNPGGREIEFCVEDSVTELGIYSFGIFTQNRTSKQPPEPPRPPVGALAEQLARSEGCDIEIPGFLARTKPPSQSGGGINSGCAHLSSITLI